MNTSTISPMTPEMTQQIRQAVGLLVARCYIASASKGFWNDHDQMKALLSEHGNAGLVEALDHMMIGQKIALGHSELSEALEGDRKNLNSDKLPGFSSVEEELADTVIRIADLSGRIGARLGEAIIAKLEYNAGRAYMHGKAY